METKTKTMWLILIFLTVLLIPLAKASAAEAEFTQVLAWSAKGNALRYRIEVQNLSTSSRSFYDSTKTYVELTLPAGEYQYRVHTYDLLGQEADVSEWRRFTVNKASYPQIGNIQKEVVLPTTGEYLILSISIEDVVAASVVELIGIEDGKTIRGAILVPREGVKPGENREGSEIESAKEVIFENVSEGRYKIRIRNPSGLYTETDEFTVVAPPPVLEGILAEAPEIDPATLPEKRLPRVKEEPEEEAPEAIAEVQEDEPPQEPKERKALDINFLVGGGIMFSPYDGTLMKKYGGESVFSPAIRANLSWLPLHFLDQKIGIEVNAMGTRLLLENDYLTQNLYLVLAQGALVWQNRIFIDNLFVSVKLGGGLGCFIQNTEYTSYYKTRGEEQTKTLLAPSAYIGASLFFIPIKHIVLEAGVNFSHIFANGMQTGILEPYLCIGVRF